VTEAETWRRVLNAIDSDAPPALELAERLADARGLDVAAAQERVYDALDGGLLVEEGEGFGGVRLADDVETADTAESTTEDDGFTDETPTPEGSKTPVRGGISDDSEGLAAFKDAIRFFHSRLDRTIHPDEDRTAREHFRDGRGWDDETIDAKRLGWAPGSETALLDHLMAKGYDRDAILATGLFWDDLSPIWKGRLVLPYLDEDGDPIFAISRTVEHPADDAGDYGDGPAKYHKIPKPGERAVEEPIYGLSTVEEGEDVLITEGVADAITAHQAGYACVSPVTTTFKTSERERLADELRDREVGRVYIVQDAEEPGSDVDEEGRLTLPQFGEGVRGAVSTAAFLTEAGVETYLGELPRPGLAKVDLDDYIQDWGALGPVLASAKPAEEHPAYDDSASDGSEDSDDEDPTPGKSGSTSSALFDLDLVDVASVARGERTTNPLGHHGESENYYVVADDGETAYDHKYKATYNALTHLLVKATERDADSPDGDLDDEELFVAWREAKDSGALGSDDPVPYRALRGIAVEDGLVDRDDLVRRDSETGQVVEDDEADSETYLALPSGTYDQVLAHIEDTYGVDSGREPASGQTGDEDDEEYGRDPRELEATVDARRAWDAAGRVTPDEVDSDVLDAADDDPEAFECPDCGEPVDVVRAVGLAEGLIDACDEALGEAYPEAYRLAREEYGAPLPAYYTTADAIAEFDAVLDVIGEVGFFDLDEEAIRSDITARDDEVGGEAVTALNPAWRLSESGESVLVFDSGTVWDADTERVLDALRFVALDSGLLADASESLEGEGFTEAYRRARTEYGAPLPRWEPAEDGARDVTPMLPPSEELVDARDLDGVDPDALDAAREEVERLIGEVTAEAGDPTVVTSLPATGKTTGTVKTARERPLSYLAPRKELQQQALDKAEKWGVDAEVLPVFSEERLDEDVLAAAVAHVREHGKDRLRDRWSVLAAAVGDVDEEEDDVDIFAETDDDEDDVDLDRATCPTAEGEHGDAWALAVHVARRLGYTPEEIHNQARGLFGAPLPCSEEHSEDGEACEYGEAWDDIRDPDAPADLLVGSYVHAHVDSVRTHFTRAADGTRDTSPRAVVLDEFPGEAFASDYGEEALDYATWLARALREDVADRRDMFDADLWSDDWVRAWLRGDADEYEAVEDAVAGLARQGDLLDARDAAAEIREDVDSEVLDALGIAAPLDAFLDGESDATEAYDRLGDAVNVDPERPAAGVARWVEDAVVRPLEDATDLGTTEPDTEAIGVDVEALPIAGDLRDLAGRAVEAVEEKADGARGILRAATTALTGGRDGCRRLAAWANDGYAHPDAHHILEAVATPTGADSDVPEARRVHTSEWAFDPDATDGTVLDVVETTGGATTVVDRNDHGALLHTPPSRSAAGGEDVPLVGLDATGRASLWSVSLGEHVTTADIHETPAERAAFLEDALDLRVIQAAERPRYYEGDPTTKDTDGDVALLEALADEYGGIEAPRERGATPTSVGKPAAITTKGVRELLENDTRLDDVVGAWENYGNVTGANDLGEHRLAAILGTQHYGDHAIERFAALAGEEVDTDRAGGRGATLSYDSDLADEYLAHMTEDQTMQAILRFARGDSGATVVARTSALREDLPVVGRGQVVETWSDTATTIARQYRRLGGEFTAADVRDAVDVSARQVRRVLAELVDAGYLQRVGGGAGRANVYERVDEPGAGEVDLPERGDAVAATGEAGSPRSKQYYTWNVRVFGGEPTAESAVEGGPMTTSRAPPAPTAVEGVEPPG
jgi:hypothetical protein